MLSRIPLARKSVLVGGLAAVSLGITGVALAVPSGLVLPSGDAPSVTVTVTPTSTATEDADDQRDDADDADDADGAVQAAPTATEAPAAEDSPAADRTCPWPTPTATTPATGAGTDETAGTTASPAPHDNGLHCGWYKPGHRDGQHQGKGHDGSDASGQSDKHAGSPKAHPGKAPHGKGAHGSSD